MALSLGIIFGLLSMIGFGLSSAISQTPIKKLGGTLTIFIRNVFATIILLVLLFFFKNEITFNLKYIGIAILISLVGYIPLASYFQALKYEKVGIVSPIAGCAVMVSVLLSIIFYQESLAKSQIIAICLIISGIIFISTNFKAWKKSDILHSKGVHFALISLVLWGIIYFLFKIPSIAIGGFLTAFIIESGIMVWSGIHLINNKPKWKTIDKRLILYLFVLGILTAMGTLFFVLGVKIAPVSIIAPIIAANPLITTLYGKFIFKEKLNKWQYLAITMMLIGMVIISIA